jgi:hypothetical protein
MVSLIVITRENKVKQYGIIPAIPGKVFKDNKRGIKATAIFNNLWV